MKHVVIFQRRLVHYRIEFFNRLRKSLAEHDVVLNLVVGDVDAETSVKKDGGYLSWALQVTNREFNLLGRKLVWQPVPTQIRKSDLVIVTQENKILSNYFLQLTSLLGLRKIAFWGHGKNFQSNSPNGIPEIWKRFWLRKVDWWFAYTEMSKRAVLSAGFDQSRITVLNNSLDGRQLLSDFDGVSGAELSEYFERCALPADSFVGLYCGSLYAEKNIDFLVEAAVQLKRELPNFHLLVLGDGPEASKIIDAAVSCPWIHYKGMQKGPEKAKAFKAASFLMNPGAVGLSVVESFVTGRPIVTIGTAPHGPEVEYLLDRKNAVVLPDVSVKKYVSAVANLANDETFFKILKSNCSADASVYSLDAMVDNFSQGIVSALDLK
jgi:glycosyltransferase involved in cell wall biosynthesis